VSSARFNSANSTPPSSSPICCAPEANHSARPATSAQWNHPLNKDSLSWSFGDRHFFAKSLICRRSEHNRSEVTLAQPLMQ
jgi:hypothetical protein